MLCPQRLHQFWVLVVVLQGCFDLSGIEIELRRNVLDGEVLLTNLRADLKDTDTGTLDPRFPVEDIGRLDYSGAGSHEIQ